MYKLFNTWLSSKYSPVHDFKVLKYQENKLIWWLSISRLNNLPIGSFLRNFDISCAGTSINKQEAINRCIGETYERYCHFNSKLIENKRIDIDILDLFPKCSKEENCLESFKERESGHYAAVKVQSLLTNKPVYIPSEFVFLDIRNKSNLVTMPITTGAAFHTDFEKALIGGILEVIERHCFMKFWLLKLCPIKINLTNVYKIDIDILTRINRIIASGLSIDIYLIENEFKLPVIFSVISSEIFPFISVGISCKMDHNEAIKKSIDEAISLRIVSIQNISNSINIDINNFSWVDSLEKHSLLYAKWENSTAFDFIFNSNKFIEISQVSNFLSSDNPNISDIEYIKYKLNINKFETFFVDITRPEIKTEGYVVKVIIPDAIPLSQSFNARWLNTSTLKFNKVFNSFPQPFS